jgi:hypothetical protein
VRLCIFRAVFEVHFRHVGNICTLFNRSYPDAGAWVRKGFGQRHQIAIHIYAVGLAGFDQREQLSAGLCTGGGVAEQISLSVQIRRQAPCFDLVRKTPRYSLSVVARGRGRLFQHGLRVHRVFARSPDRTRRVLVNCLRLKCPKNHATGHASGSRNIGEGRLCQTMVGKDDFGAVEYALPRLQRLLRCPLHLSFSVPHCP